jgi:ATP-dependent Clp protease ATP-binding subunit ClpC
MFEHFDERARRCTVLAQAEARRLGHEEIGTVHLLLGIARLDDGLLGVAVEVVRATVVALHGSGQAATVDAIAFTAEATATLKGANAQALALGHTTIDLAHVLLALLDAGGGGARALREAGAIPSEVRERALAVAGSGRAGERPPGHADGHADALRAGDALAVTLGSDPLPIGDLGHPSVDRHLHALLLVNDTRAARLLRAHGIDEPRLERSFGPAGADPPA